MVFESFIGIVFVSIFANGFVDDVNWDFLILRLFTVVLLEFSFLITDCCFFFGFIIDCSTLTFLILAGLTIGTGENGRFCGGEWRTIGSDGSGTGGFNTSSVSLSPLSSLFADSELLSLIFYSNKKDK